ncbi:MAG: WD40 repeat domain-containing protein [Polyangiaceae bacterium]
MQRHGVKVWEVTTRFQLARWEGHSDAVYGVDIRRDGALAATGGDDGTVKLWELPSGHLVATPSTTRGDASPDGRWAAAGERRGTIYVWDLGSKATGGS